MGGKPTHYSRTGSTSGRMPPQSTPPPQTTCKQPQITPSCHPEQPHAQRKGVEGFAVVFPPTLRSPTQRKAQETYPRNSVQSGVLPDCRSNSYRAAHSLVIFTPMSELRDFIFRRSPKQNRQIEEGPGSVQFALPANELAGYPRVSRNFPGARPAGFRGNRSTFPCHAMTRFQGGESGCTGQQFENVTTGNCYYLPAGAVFLCSTKVCA